ncbi:hypothetical protein COW36_03735 [bacterium (Candidatus Blackallbacteria) CG17_big_fil_post_rev_8_21_14_2_50_48_46]|uniref:Uncharacterized protein n=1 Tax=bacterium (Candidatus Blackallbacteria) CG17_big_fil_post_rev_8_21_14_2_50_48_46 TaxID=2014261 RepID=A0A2M7G8I2_9BACT|nr:MAG: hypothetical protein COW64_20905 [bacterium (Candidatus Blackallbacteria) CG18_big_fil_WC_8_21_14_2_50_49_26]PIW18412.1 MAG: hypothetical protein COW36_03735 [bacterium (Candidatus Blackallbacteria) CG17_big_fil_post_rev_8_21_14_2_50_48_46]PIW50571.1 MAG: hypothetical protein COW20_02160 [bacterium (Candidatus Blackallbacteria) CG13_big_fil_rev_8_21_14_2_50_49_14]
MLELVTVSGTLPSCRFDDFKAFSSSTARLNQPSLFGILALQGFPSLKCVSCFQERTLLLF